MDGGGGDGDDDEERETDDCQGSNPAATYNPECNSAQILQSSVFSEIRLLIAPISEGSREANRISM